MKKKRQHKSAIQAAHQRYLREKKLLKESFKMKEYWVNVYAHSLGKNKYPTRYEAEIGSRILNYKKCIYGFNVDQIAYKESASYRIHVKMDGGYNNERRARAPIYTTWEELENIKAVNKYLNEGYIRYM